MSDSLRRASSRCPSSAKKPSPGYRFQPRRLDVSSQSSLLPSRWRGHFFENINLARGYPPAGRSSPVLGSNGGRPETKIMSPARVQVETGTPHFSKLLSNGSTRIISLFTICLLVRFGCFPRRRCLDDLDARAQWRLVNAVTFHWESRRLREP